MGHSHGTFPFSSSLKCPPKCLSTFSRQPLSTQLNPSVAIPLDFVHTSIFSWCGRHHQCGSQCHIHVHISLSSHLCLCYKFIMWPAKRDVNVNVNVMFEAVCPLPIRWSIWVQRAGAKELSVTAVVKWVLQAVCRSKPSQYSPQPASQQHSLHRVKSEMNLTHSSLFWVHGQSRKDAGSQGM